MPIEQVNAHVAESTPPPRRGSLARAPDDLAGNPGSRSGYAALLLLLLAGLGVVLVVLSTRWGIGVSSDSAGYIEGARNLVRGYGYSSAKEGRFEAITHWPPFYSLVLAGFGAVGMDPAAGARVLGALLLGANILLVGLVAGREGGPAAALVSGLVLVSSFTMLSIHAMAWTEPLFLFAAVLGLYLLAHHLRRPAMWVLAASALVIGLAFLTRYPGIALIGTGVLAILWLSGQSWWRRVADAGLFLAISAAPMLAWRLSSPPADRGVGRREIAFHPPDLEHLKVGLGTVAAWVIPAGVPVRLRVLLFLGVTAALLYFLVARTPLRRVGATLRASTLLRVSGLFVAVYLALLTVSITLFDVATFFDTRILAPVYLIGVLALGIGFPALHAQAAPRSRRVLIGTLAAFLLLSFAYNALWAAAAYREGLVYASREWRESEIVELVRSLPAGTPIYSNADDVLYFHTRRPVASLPWKWDPFSRRENPDYPAELAAMLAELREREGVVVFSRLIDWRDYLPAQEELERECALEATYRGEEGAIYRAADRAGCPES